MPPPLGPAAHPHRRKGHRAARDDAEPAEEGHARVPPLARDDDASELRAGEERERGDAPHHAEAQAKGFHFADLREGRCDERNDRACGEGVLELLGRTQRERPRGLGQYAPEHSPYRNSPKTVPTTPTAVLVHSASRTMPDTTPDATKTSMAPRNSASGPESARPKKEPVLRI